VTSTQHGPMSTPGSQAPLVPSSGRVSILVGESHQIDVVLPAAVPLAALVDPAREAVNRDMRARGEEELPHGSYEFVRAVGMTALSGDASLVAQGVVDGDLLALVPAERRNTLIARRQPGNGNAVYRFDIHLQGDNETVFFDI